MSEPKTTCAERDNIILAYLLAVNQLNELASQLEDADGEADRLRLGDQVSAANAECHALRSRLMEHCLQHQC